VLDAAALTYVASAVSILGTLLQLIFIFNRSRD
jgi:Zn-dependent membrane protease YugP